MDVNAIDRPSVATVARTARLGMQSHLTQMCAQDFLAGRIMVLAQHHSVAHRQNFSHSPGHFWVLSVACGGYLCVAALP